MIDVKNKQSIPPRVHTTKQHSQWFHNHPGIKFKSGEMWREVEDQQVGNPKIYPYYAIFDNYAMKLVIVVKMKI